MDGIRSEEKAKIQLFENELKLKTELQKDRIGSIHKKVSMGKSQSLITLFDIETVHFKTVHFRRLSTFSRLNRPLLPMTVRF